MTDDRKSKTQLIAELRQARQRLADLEAGDRESEPGGGPRRAGSSPHQGGLGSAVVDIGLRSRTERELAELAHQLTIVLNSTPDLVFVKDLELRTVLCNEVFAGAVGKTPVEMIGNTDIENGWDPELVRGSPGKGIRGFERDDREALSGTHVHNPPEPVNVGDEIRFFDTHKIPLRDADGTITGVLGIARDVTENKRAEDARRIALERLTATLSALPDIMFDVDREGNIYDFHAPDPSVLAVPPESFLNKNVSEVLPAEVVEIIMRSIAKASETGLHRGAIYSLAMGDELRWYELSIAVRGTSTPRTRFVALVRDVTERKHAELALLDADRRKDDFLALLGHELRNPLAPIRNAVHVLSREESLSDRLRWGVDVIARQSEHLERLVSDLLDIARITSGRIQLRLSPVAVGDALESAVQVVSPLMEQRGQSYRARLPESPVVVEADPVRLAQILTNLLHNAAKYTPSGGHIEVSVERRGSDAVIRIRDDGVGIPSADVPRLFEPFFRAKAAGSEQAGDTPTTELDGLGLGLPLAKDLAERHGGTLECHSEGRGAGAEFVVTLPVYSSAVASTSSAVAVATENAPVDPRRILVVDDNPDVGGSFRMLLEAMGHEARALSAAGEAVAMVREWRPHVVFLDIAMPGMDGYEVAAAIRAARPNPRPILIALTGYGDNRHENAASAAGFDHYLLKPANPTQIEALLAK